MAQRVAYGDPVDPRMLGEIIGSMVGNHRRVQRQHAAIDEQQHRVGEHRLARRSHFEQGRIINAGIVPGDIVPGLQHAEPARPCQPPLLDHRDADTRHAQRLHLPWQVLQQFF